MNSREPKSLMLDQLSWLEGSWERMREGKPPSYEDWERSSDDAFKGRGYSITPAGDTTVFETLSIIQRSTDDGNRLVYAADVDHNEGAVEFICAGEQDGVWLFSNPDHDFPQLISYAPSEDGTSLHVQVIGPDGKGGTRTIDFRFRRAD